jgi:hypothetical protein
MFKVFFLDKKWNYFERKDANFAVRGGGWAIRRKT